MIVAAYWMLAFFGMAGFALWCNYDWAKEYDKCSTSWFKLSSCINNNWTNVCGRIEKERDAFKAKAEELEAKAEELEKRGRELELIGEELRTEIESLTAELEEVTE